MTQPAPATAPPDPAKVQAELAKARADAAKAQADARAAEAAAAKAEREAAEYDSPGQRAKRDAEAAKDAAAARREQLTALIPDFGKVERGSLEVSGDQPLYGTALAQRALRDAAADIVSALRPVLGDRTRPAGTTAGPAWRVLVTSDPDLATADAAYLGVTTGIDQLIEAARRLLPDRDTGRSLLDSVTTAGLTALDLGAALAGALPGVLSLFSAHRTVNTTPVTVGDLAAAATVAGAIVSAHPGAGSVVHADVRLVESGRVHRKVAELATERQRLVGLKLTLTDESTTAHAEADRYLRAITALEEQLKADQAADQAAVRAEIETAEQQRVAQQTVVSRNTVRLGLVDSVITAIDAFTAALTTVPEGGTRSPLTSAALHERFHAGAESPFTHVLLVKSESGSAQQLVNDRPVWFEDRFSVVATIAVTYMLIEVPGSDVLAAGTATGSASGHGTIGDRFELT